MVENFTPIKDDTYDSDLEIIKNDDEFEAKIKHSIQHLAKDPHQQIIDNILNYSKSLVK